MEKSNHFQQSELKERQELQNLFNNFFNKKNCNQLALTQSNSFAPFDAIFLSGNNRTVIIEHKSRSISSKQYQTAFIELHKLKSLSAYFNSGVSVFYAMRYSDGITVVWSLDRLYQFHKDYSYPIDHNVERIPASATSADPSRKVIKEILHLKLTKADYFITSDYKQLSREEFASL
jgi:hypothetical protein